MKDQAIAVRISVITSSANIKLCGISLFDRSSSNAEKWHHIIGIARARSHKQWHLFMIFARDSACLRSIRAHQRRARRVIALIVNVATMAMASK